MADLFVQGRAALGTISDASAKVAQQVYEWREQIDTFTTVEEINRAILPIQKMAAVVAPQVKKLLMDRARLLQLVWDPTTKAFKEPTNARPTAVAQATA